MARVKMVRPPLQTGCALVFPRRRLLRFPRIFLGNTVPTDFQQLVDALHATRHRLLESDDEVAREALRQVLATFIIPVELAPPLAKGLANVTATHSEALKRRLERGSASLTDVSVGWLVERLCKSLADLKAALAQNGGGDAHRIWPNNSAEYLARADEVPPNAVVRFA
jgi:hypothetical protein